MPIGALDKEYEIGEFIVRQGYEGDYMYGR